MSQSSKTTSLKKSSESRSGSKTNPHAKAQAEAEDTGVYCSQLIEMLQDIIERRGDCLTNIRSIMIDTNERTRAKLLRY